MQYQAQTDIVQLIERLEKACIRFVHFSKENELRSRVFSEKMGLDGTSWNCHIVLSESDVHSNASPKNSHHSEDKTNGDQEFSRLLPLTCLESSKTLSSSAPCAISDTSLMQNPPSPTNSNKESDPDSSTNQHRTSKDSAMEVQDALQSLSCLSDSTEQSAQIPIYMSNRVSTH
jgi:hypothetical protein